MAEQPEPNFVRGPDVAVHRVAGMAVLVDLGATSPVLDGRVHVLTPTAETVWMLLDRPVTIHGLVDRVLGQYDGPRQAILRDVTRLVDQLVALDMALLVSGDLSSHSR